jgi:hypothetical protein
MLVSKREKKSEIFLFDEDLELVMDSDDEENYQTTWSDEKDMPYIEVSQNRKSGDNLHHLT